MCRAFQQPVKIGYGLGRTRSCLVPLAFRFFRCVGMDGVAYATTFRFFSHEPEARFVFRTVNDVRHGWAFYSAYCTKSHHTYVVIRKSFTAIVDLHQDASGILQVEHRHAEHFPIGVARMRVVGVLDGDRKMVLERILDLRGDLRVGEIGQE